MKRLYHGSNEAIEQIDLSRSKRGKDFGQGFYLNANPDQAMEMAVRTTRFLNEGTLTLSCFEFDEDEATKNGLIIKIFPDYSEAWAESVVMNRKNDSDVPIGRYPHRIIKFAKHSSLIVRQGVGQRHGVGYMIDRDVSDVH